MIDRDAHAMSSIYIFNGAVLLLMFFFCVWDWTMPQDNWAIDVKADQDAGAIGDLAKKISSKLNPAKGGKSPFQL